MVDKKTIFIDWHNTLSTDLLFSSYKDNTQGLPLRKAIDDSVFSHHDVLHSWLRGGINSEQIIQRVAQYTGLDFDLIWPLFIKDCETISLAPSLDQKLLQLKDKYHTVLVTDNMDCFSRFTIPAQNLSRYFHGVSNSYDCKLMKKDDQGKIFIQLAHHYEVDVSQCILLDDSETVTRIFSALGGTSHRVKNPEHTCVVIDTLLAA